MLALFIAGLVLVFAWVAMLGAILWAAAVGIALLLRAALALFVGFARLAIRTRPR